MDEAADEGIGAEGNAQHLNLRMRNELNLARLRDSREANRAGVHTIGVQPRPLAFRRVKVQTQVWASRLNQFPNLQQSGHICDDTTVIHVPLVVDNARKSVDLVNQGHDAAAEVEWAKWVTLLDSGFRLDDVLVVIEEHRRFTIAPVRPGRHGGEHRTRRLDKLVAADLVESVTEVDL